jgi:CBS domain-containing protein
MMKSMLVKDLMVPLSEYATISQDASLLDAIRALEKAQAQFHKSRYVHRAVLVYDEAGKIVGKLSQIDIIRGLEPKYEEVGDVKHRSLSAFSPTFFKTMFDHLKLWEKPLRDLCKTTASRKVKDVMCTPARDEYVEADATLDEAIHRLILGSHQSLIVARGEEIVGILRLTDVFQEISTVAKTCGIES